MKLTTLFPVLFLFALSGHSQDSLVLKNYTTIQVEAPPTIDGSIDDASWAQVPWGEGFTVQQPNNGDMPKNQTRFKIIYDKEHLYVAYHCFNEDPADIESRLSRRDNFPGDWVEINIDSYDDNLTGYSFTLSVSGVKGDEFIANNGQDWDTNWNPIWYGKAKVVNDGWTAEMKIPFSQLRFGKQENYTWGFNINRRDFGASERSSWQFIPQNVSGFVSNFANLHGLKNLKPKRQVELQPYITSSLVKEKSEAGNPFSDGTDTKLNVGIDGKIGITNDITLDFTINPDFGQVEADPSALNLDGFQIFFDERRPFFIENANLFSTPISRIEAGGPFGNDNLFYSRRIGAQPRGFAEVPNDAFTDRPNFTSIIGAAKVSGKTKNGLSFGLLETITAEEKLTYDLDGNRDQKIIEPLSNYAVGSVRQDFNNGATTIGFTLTSVDRKLEETGLEDQYHSSAHSGGLDVLHTWKEQEWRLRGNFIMSNIQGTTEKIKNTQESFEHYFQRPDATHLTVDETLTSLSGHGGTVSLGNYGGKDNLSFQGAFTWRSPGLELNDIGFMNSADQLYYAQWVGYRFPKPFSVFRSFRINYNHFARWTYDGEPLFSGINMNAHAGFTNYWSLGGGMTYELNDISTKALFGGPKLRRSPGINPWFYINSDDRKNLTYGMNGFLFIASGLDREAVSVRGINGYISYQPTDALRLSVRPNFFHQKRAIQNVSFRNFNGENRYVTGRIDQKTLSMSLRANYSLSPNITIEYWGQPFISRGNYSEFKYITDPLAKVYTDRFELYSDRQISSDEDHEVFSIDEDMDGITDYSFGNPDFSFIQFRSNLVFRWEYKPNSEFFLVWTQGTTNFGDPEKGLLPSLKDDLFSAEASNIFLMKLTYRFY